MQKLTDLLDTTRPDPRELRPVDVEELVTRARTRSRVTTAAVTVGSVAAAVAVALAVGQVTGPGELLRPDVAGSPSQEPAPPATVGTWTQVDSPLSPRRSAATATTTDGRLVVFGGAGDSGDGNANEWQADGAIYDPDRDEWTLIPPLAGVPALASGRFGQASLARDRLLVLGSDGSDITGAVYDLAEGTWLPVPRTQKLGTYADAVTWDGRTLTALRLGFRDGVAEDPTLLRWEVGDDAWSAGAPPPVGARNYAATSFNGRELFVWGGTVAADIEAGGQPIPVEAGKPAPGATSDGLLYAVDTDTWTRVSPAPLPPGMRGDATWLDDTHVAVISNDGVVESGDSADGHHQVAVYDTQTQTWARIDPAATGFDRPFFQFGAHGNEGPRRPAGGHGVLVAVDADRPQSFPIEPWSSQLRIYDPATRTWNPGPNGGSGHVIEIGGIPAATTAAGGNPGDHSFEVAVRTDEGWRLTPEAAMRNRMDAAITADDDRIYVFGGMAGRDIELRADLWILDLSAERSNSS